MNWNIAICDDEHVETELLQGYLQHLEAERGDSFSVRSFSSGEQLLAQFSKNTDILLMDIGMNGISGLDTIRKLREQETDVCVIFITSLTQYAIEGYSVHAFGFLPKPLSYLRFRRTMDEALAALESEKSSTLALPVETGTQYIDFTRVCYVEVYGRMICVTRENGLSLECRMSLANLERVLNSWKFFRCHNNFLVNFAYVERIESGKLTMKDGRVIPVSKHRYQELLLAIGRYARATL